MGSQSHSTRKIYKQGKTGIDINHLMSEEAIANDLENPNYKHPPLPLSTNHGGLSRPCCCIATGLFSHVHSNVYLKEKQQPLIWQWNSVAVQILFKQIDLFGFTHSLA